MGQKTESNKGTDERKLRETDTGLAVTQGKGGRHGRAQWVKHTVLGDRALSGEHDATDR